MDIVYQHGGVYLDTDVELIAPLDELVQLSCFVGMEKPGRVNFGVGFGAEPGNAMVSGVMEMYDGLSFVDDDVYLAEHASPVYQTAFLKKIGMTAKNERQELPQVTVLPTSYLCPKDMDTGVVTLEQHTVSIHHFDGSWADDVTRYGYRLKWKCVEKYGRTFGKTVYYGKYVAYLIKHQGVLGMAEKVKRKLRRRFARLGGEENE